MMHYCLYGEGKPSTLEIGEFEITQQHQLVNRPYPYPRHITRFETLSHRGNGRFNSSKIPSSCPIPLSEVGAENFCRRLERVRTNEAEKILRERLNDSLSKQVSLPSLY